MRIGGREVSNWYLIGGAAGAVAVVYLVRKNSSSSAVPAGTIGQAGTDPVTGMPYAQDQQVDPVTGMTYLNEAQQYGSVQAAEAAVSGGPGASQGWTAGGPAYGGGGGVVTQPGYATDAQWAQAAQAGLSGLGYDPQAIATALGLFFARHPLTSAQAGIVQAAEAEYGPPPQGTWEIIPVPSGGGTPNAGGGGYHRHVASGRESLDHVASARHITAAHIEQVTRDSQAHGGISPRNLALFNAYVASGTGKPMPRGLVYYTSTP